MSKSPPPIPSEQQSFQGATNLGRRDADAILKDHGLIVRPLPALNALRITIGTAEENEMVLRALTDCAAAYCR